jgi:thymidylate synthase (FAD)
MIFIKPSVVNLTPFHYSYEDIVEFIATCARVCYDSKKEATSENNNKLFNQLIERKHMTPLEHGTVYLIIKTGFFGFNDHLIDFFEENEYSRVNYHKKKAYITTNMRVIIENKLLDRVKAHMVYVPSSHHDKRLTAYIITDRSVSHELVRHRQLSVCQQSQRYVKYDCMEFVIPVWSNIKPGAYCGVEDFWRNDKLSSLDKQLLTNASYAESSYRLMKDYPPQQVRKILPNMTKTILVVTGYQDYFEDVFFPQRLFGETGKPDPDMENIAYQMYESFGYDPE